ncbi:LacI family DNA-binding transcriptional regulator [Dactylosporangium fulvum]|uniref:LacI family DNA-binding transcriptional regulator n=1 Tax=Dactylosporangium fulvum TaxID=53359 RepID=UPI0031D14038
MHHRRPTILDVARAAGVSRATASRVINNVPGASDVVRSRVHQVVADLGYRPNEIARALASGRRGVVDLVVFAPDPGLSWLGVHPYYSRVLAGMMPVLDGRDAQLRVHVAQADGSAAVIDTVAEAATAGAVLVNVPPELALRFHARCRRVVSLAATADRVPAVDAENAAGAYAAVSHLHRLGRRRIAAVHGPASNSCAADRRVGYLAAVRDLGLPGINADGGFIREGGHRAALQLLADHPDIDGLFVACDLMGAGAVQAITAAGRKIPDDVAVIGFDDSIAATCSNPPLTTVRLPVEEMAAEATSALLDGTVTPGWRRMFTVELVVRESAGPA